MKRIAALTMVRNDDFYLRKWVDYYGTQLGRQNLFIFFDGQDQDIPAFCAGTQAVKLDKIGKDVVSNDKGRVAVLSQKAAELFAAGYQLVLGTDADEFVVVDPALGKTLPEYLSSVPVKSSLSPLGLDFGQKLGEETDLRADEPFLRQRRYALLSTRYTKCAILARPLRWGSGFHRVKGHTFHIAKGLYLLHFGYSDQARIQARFQDTSRLEQGWERHLRKRSRTIRLVTQGKARDFENWTRRARWCQMLVRPPYALNKPAMFGAHLVVRLPERFQDLV